MKKRGTVYTVKGGCPKCGADLIVSELLWMHCSKVKFKNNQMSRYPKDIEADSECNYVVIS